VVAVSRFDALLLPLRQQKALGFYHVVLHVCDFESTSCPDARESMMMMMG
jgi:hypothetical protein